MHLTSGADYYASLRTPAAMEKAEVAVVLVDASEPLTEQDPASSPRWSRPGRALVIAYNKWDLLDEERRYYLEREIERDLVQVQWAPRVNISARTGRHMEKLVPAIETALARGRPGSRRVGSTPSSANWWPPTRTPCGAASSRASSSRTQASARPPRFVRLRTGFLDAGYRRFIERRLREEFGFEGSPIEISVRVREKRSAQGKR